MAKKIKPLNLSAKQLEHLISLSVRNSLDVVGDPVKEGIRFLIVLECLSPENCISVSEVPSSEKEEWSLLECHGVAELSNFLERTLTVRANGETCRAVETCPINGDNVEELLLILDEMCNYWDDVFENEPLSLEGKNVVEGNGTLN